LARRGHVVRHAYFDGVQGPKGALSRRVDDPPTLDFERRVLAEPYAKYGIFKRWSQERRYGQDIAGYIVSEKPDVIISSNTPLDVQRAMQRAGRKAGSAFVIWLQDVLSIGMKGALAKKLGYAGSLVGDYYGVLERQALRDAHHIVCICDEFKELLETWSLPEDRISVIENWAPLDEIVPLSKDNTWARAHGLNERTVFLYAGTMGLKHDPELLLRLAEANADDPKIAVVVASEGIGADWLKEHFSHERTPGLVLLPFQRYEDLPKMLATADVLVAVIEADAARFSVPSKVLSYLAAGRSVLLSVPGANYAAKLVRKCEAGLVVEPNDKTAFLAAAERLIEDPSFRQGCAANARKSAEEKFDIAVIADRFLAAAQKALFRAHRP
jgi:colanic acid biosynthesis glycosyl transferase WcaI